MFSKTILIDYLKKKKNKFQSKSKLGKTIAILKNCLAALCFVYLATIVFPQPLFRYKITHNNISLYGNDKKVLQSGFILHRVQALISKSELYKSNMPLRIFVCDSYLFYTYFSPKSSDSFAINNPIGSNVFIAKTDLERDLSFCDKQANNTRRLSSVAAHDLTHILIRKEIGIIDEKRTPRWKKEGYCDYIANDSSFDYDKGIHLLVEGKSDSSISFMYFQSRMIVEYLIKEKHKSFMDIYHGSFSETQLRDEMVLHWRKKKVLAKALNGGLSK